MTPEDFQLADKLFRAAAELSEDERPAFLDERSGGRADVRAMVERLLRSDKQLGDRLQPTDGSALGLPPVSTIVDAAGPIPTRIGQYRIIRECGRGGMGTVYEAQQERPQRRVAVKVMRSGSPLRLRRRFDAEAEILGRLQHPGIAQIFEAGSYDTGEGGRPFFAMEFIDGPPLDAYAREHGLDRRQRLALVARIADAVHYAHQQGVVHRDLKPSNVLVMEEDATSSAGTATGTGSFLGVGQPKILDFGIARMTDADVQVTTLQTSVGELIGTLAYMSPEQAAGDSTNIDTRSDIYTLGVILFELLAGRPPHDLGRTVPDAVRTICEDHPTRLGTVDGSLRGDVETIVETCLQKEPERRYQSASDVAADIRRHLRNEPITARPASALYYLRLFARRNRAAVVGAVMTLVMLVAGSIVATLSAIRAGENAANARRESYRAGITAASAVMVDDPTSARRYLEQTPEEHRGWEWRHLASLLDRQAARYVGPARPGGQVAYTGDGAHLVALMDDGTVAVWNARDSTLIRTIDIGKPARSLAVHPADPVRLAMGTGDGHVVTCDLEGADRRERKLADESIVGVAWDPVGARVAAATATRLLLADSDGTVSEFDIDERDWCNPSDARLAVAFSPDGSRLARVALEQGPPIYTHRHLILCDVNELQQIALFTPAQQLLGFAWSNDGSRLYACTFYRFVYELDGETLEVSRRFEGHRSKVSDVAVSPTGDVATRSDDGTIRLWRDGTTVATIQHAAAESVDVVAAVSVGATTDEPMLGLAFSPDGSSLVDAGGGEWRRWDLDTDHATVLEGHASYVYNLSYARDGSLLASSDLYSTEALMWDPRTGRRIGAVNVNERVTFLEFTPDGRLRANNGLFDPRTGSRLGAVKSNWSSIRRPDDVSWDRLDPAVVRSKGGAFVALRRSGAWSDAPASSYSSQWDFTVRDARGALRLEYRAEEGDRHVEGADFSPDERLLATADLQGGVVEIMDLVTGDVVARLTGHAGFGPAYCAVFHPDGTRLATGGNDNLIRIWDTETWEQVHELRGHTSYVKCLAFSPDGTQLASASGDFTVRIWDTVSRAERRAAADG